MPTEESENIAGYLYRKAVKEPGYDPPFTYAELLEIVIQSGTPVVWCRDAPQGFEGVEIRGTIFVNGFPLIPDYKRMRILAHEWGHALQRQLKEDKWPLYHYGGRSLSTADLEEEIAVAFERLF